jgi:hypothetical protein
MEPALLEVLRDAVQRRRRDETLEKAVGRAVRNRNLDFAVYIKIMSEVRQFAEAHGLEPDDAVPEMLDEKKDDP